MQVARRLMLCSLRVTSRKQNIISSIFISLLNPRHTVGLVRIITVEAGELIQRLQYDERRFGGPFDWI
jgi:hypothetical protein